MKKINLKELEEFFKNDEIILEDIEISDTVTNYHFVDQNLHVLKMNKLLNRKRISSLKMINCIINVDCYIEDLEIGYVGFNKVIINKMFCVRNCNFNLFYLSNINFSDDKSDIRIAGCAFNLLPGIEKSVLNNLLISDTSFKDTFYIESCIFHGDCSFHKVKFLNGFSIENSDYPTFFKKTLTLECDFHGQSSFNRCIFTRLNFKPITISGTIEFKSTNIKRIALFRDLRLNNRLIFKSVDLTNCSFLYSTFEEVVFTNCKFNFGSMIDEKLLNNLEDIKDVEEIISDEYMNLELLEYNVQDVINEYRSFETNLDKYKDYELAGEFHKKRFELQLKNEKQIFRKFLITLYKWFSNYGEDYTKSLVWGVGILFGFSIIYLFTGLKYNGSIIYYFDSDNMYRFLNDYGCSFVYSLNSSVPFRRELEFIKPANGCTTFFSIIQTFLQTIIGTLFIVALRRKFRR